MQEKYAVGQRVKIIPLKGSDPGADRRIAADAGKTGAVIKAYCLSEDEMPDLVKMVRYPVIFCYDIQTDSGDVIPGIPEAALAPATPRS